MSGDATGQPVPPGSPGPPVAKRVPTLLDRVTGPVVDDWAWLRDRDDPDTLAYLRAENEHTEAWFAPLGGLREQLFEEIRRRTQETDLSVPFRKGRWWYQTRTEEGQAYVCHERRPDDDGRPGGVPQVLVDENVEAAGEEFFALGVLEVSPSGRLLAWSADRSGGEVYELGFRDLDTGVDLPDRLERTSADGVAWSADERHLFYLVPDELMRPWQLWRHELGRPAAEDVLVLQENDDRFYLSVELTRSERWIVISSASRTTTEVHVVPADRPLEPPRVVARRRPGHEYTVDHRDDRFVIVTNDRAADFRVVTAPVTDPGPERWTELVPHQPGRRVLEAEAFADFVLVHEWERATPQLRLLFDDGTERLVTFDEEVHGVEPSINPEFDTTTIRFVYESYTTPSTVYDEDVRTGTRTLLKRTPVLGGFDPDQYECRREWATADDGTTVPVDVVWRRGTPLDGTAPLTLYGYGAYEVSLAPWFSIPRLSLLDRGVVFAVAHVRGGGELGRAWYLGGKLLAKRNSFTDLIAAAEHVVQAGYAASDRVAIRGGSAGGLLVGAAMCLRPERFRAVLAEVPFVDVVTTMLDPTLPLTATEWEEWGDPRHSDACAYLASYSPYDNVRPTDYPALLVTAGWNDPRVSYHEPAKWVAKLRALGTGSAPLLLWTELDAGHAGPSGRYEAWREEARNLAFLLHVLEVA